jgi:glycosyltransferase involved in cell wall biosynthesis
VRVAHYVQRYPPALGGAEAYFARLSRHLAGAGDPVTVFTTNALDLEAFWSKRARVLAAGHAEVDGVRVERYPLFRCPGRRYLLKALSLFPNQQWRCLTITCNPISWRMWHDARGDSRPFDVVHATAFPYAWPIVCALQRARRTGVPFFITPFLHLGNPEDAGDRTRRAYLSPPLRYLLEQADGIFVQTHLERSAALENGLSPEKLHLQGMGVDAAECTGGERRRARQAWHACAGEIVVGHLANQSFEKGTIDLLRAAERAWQAGAQFRVVLAGPAMPNFLAFWKSFGRKDAVVQLGVLDDPQKRDFFAGIDLFALPSRSDSFGLVLLEAWANQLPNLAYRAGGVAEVIHHEKDGLLARCGDIDDLTGGLIRLVGDPEFRARLAAHGRARALAEFDWHAKLQLVRDAYEAEWQKKKGRE